MSSAMVPPIEGDCLKVISKRYHFSCAEVKRRSVVPLLLGHDRLRQRLDELFELVGAPAFEGGAVLLVGGDHAVAVVPVQPWLGVEPEGPAGLGGDRRE